MGVHAVGFSGGSVVKNLPANSGDAGLNLGWGKSPGEGNGQPTLVFFPGKSHGQRSLVGSSLWGCKGVRHDLKTEQQQWQQQCGVKK